MTKPAADAPQPRLGRSRHAPLTGPRFRGRGEWPRMTFDHIADVGAAEACRAAQRLAVVLLDSMVADRCSMRRLARESGTDVTTVKSVLEGTYGPRLDTAVRLLVARKIPLPVLFGPDEIVLTEDSDARTIRFPGWGSSHRDR